MPSERRFGLHSLIAAYGIAPEKVIFIPHGVVLPQSIERSAPGRHLLEQVLVRSRTNASLGVPHTFPHLQHMLGRLQILPSGRECHGCSHKFHTHLNMPDFCAELPANAQLIISNGLFTHHKRLDRIVAAMGRVIDSSIQVH